MRSSVFKALAHPSRREILALLRAGPLSSGQLADAFTMAWPTISRHLAVLKTADLVTTEKTGTSIIYRANASVVEEAAMLLFSLVDEKRPVLAKPKPRSARGAHR